MKLTHHSEYLQLKSVYIKPVENAFVSNDMLSEQWEELNYLSKPEFGEAVEEYKSFENSLKGANVNVCHFPFERTHGITLLGGGAGSHPCNHGADPLGLGRYDLSGIQALADELRISSNSFRSPSTVLAGHSSGGGWG